MGRDQTAEETRPLGSDPWRGEGSTQVDGQWVPPAMTGPDDLALVLTGGGARGAYQAGVLAALGRAFPELRPPVITGISAGAINACHLAAHRRPLGDAAHDLARLWRGLTTERVLEAGRFPLARNVVHWGRQLVSGGARPSAARGLVDPSPLRDLLAHELASVDGEIVGIDHNLRAGNLRSVALTTHDYARNQAVSWVQGEGLTAWDQPNRRSVQARLTVDHVMASSALPFVFPAVRLADGWYGDGGIRLRTPLAPAIHLGANRIVAISTRYLRTAEEARRPATHGYPPPAQILGAVLTALFLDATDEDGDDLERINRLIVRLPAADRGMLRPIRLLTIRPSVDLGKLAGELEDTLPPAFRFLIRGLGTHEIEAPTFLSILLFEPEFLGRLVEIGERDGDAMAPAVERLLTDELS